jgi:hypothetical protein
MEEQQVASTYREKFVRVGSLIVIHPKKAFPWYWVGEIYFTLSSVKL